VIDLLHATKPAEPAQPVLVAGDPERAMRAERLKHGIPIPEKLLGLLRDVAQASNTEFLLAR
jgi:LDH2 family malate/lactate/ureidoglycolate dehydrogenase